MAITVTELTSGNSTTNAQTAATASITTVTGLLYLIQQDTTGAGASVPATPSGAGLTYTKVADRGFSTGASPNRDVTLWWATGSGTGAITLDSGSASCTGQLWRIYELTGVDTTNPLRQAAATNFDDTTTATSLTMTFGSSVLSTSVVLAFLGLNAQVTPTAGTGFTILGAANNMTLPSQSASAEDNLTPSGTTAAFNYAAGQVAGGIAVEIAVAPVASTSASSVFAIGPTLPGYINRRAGPPILLRQGFPNYGGAGAQNSQTIAVAATVAAAFVKQTNKVVAIAAALAVAVVRKTAKFIAAGATLAVAFSRQIGKLIALSGGTASGVPTSLVANSLFTGAYTDIDDGTSFAASNDADFIINTTAGQHATFKVAFSLAAGPITGCTINYRGGDDATAPRDLRAFLYDGATLVGTGTLHTTDGAGTITNYTDTFTGLNLDGANLQVLLDSNKPTGKGKFYEMWVDVTYAGVTLAVSFATAKLKTVAIAAATTITAAFSRSTGKLVALGATLTAAVSRSVGKPIATTTALTVAFSRKTAKAIAVALSLAVAVTTAKVKVIAIAAATTITAAFNRSVGKPLAVTATFAVALTRSVGKVITVGVTLAAAFIRKTAKGIAASATFTVSIATAKVKVITIAVATTFTVAFSRQTSKTLAAAASFAVAFSRSVGKPIAVGVTFTAAFVRSISKTIAVAVTATIALTKVKVKVITIAAVTTLTAAFSRSVGKPIAAVATLTAAFSRSVGKVIAVGVSFAVVFVRKTAKTIAAAATLTAAITTTKVKVVLIAAATTVTAAFSRSVGKLIRVFTVGYVGTIGSSGTGPGSTGTPTPTGTEIHFSTYCALDGVTDDSAGIASALAAAAAGSGVALMHAGGTAAMGSRVTVPSNVTIAGNGQATSAFKALAGLGSSNMFETDGTTGVTFRDLTLDCNGVALAYAISYRTTSSMLVDRCTFSNSAYYYIHEVSSFADGLTPLASNVTVRDCTFNTHTGGSRECVTIGYVTAFKVLRCRFSGTNLAVNNYRAAFSTLVQDTDFVNVTGTNPNAILYGRGCDDLTVTNCSLTTVGTISSAAIRGCQPQDDYITSGGLGMPDNAQRLAITHCTFDGCGVAYQVGGVLGFTDDANLIQNSLGTGVLVNSGNTSANYTGYISRSGTWYRTKFLSNMQTGGTAALFFNSTEAGLDLASSVKRCTFDDVGATQIRAVAFAGDNVPADSIFSGVAIDQTNSFIHPTTAPHLLNSATGIALTLGGAEYMDIAFSRRISKTIAAVETSAVAFVRRTAKTIAAATTLTANFLRGFIHGKTIAAATTMTVAFSRSVGKLVAVTATLTVNFARRIAKTIAVSTVVQAIIQASKFGTHVYNQAIAVAVTFAPLIARRVSKTIAVGVSLTVTFVVTFLSHLASATFRVGAPAVRWMASAPATHWLISKAQTRWDATEPFRRWVSLSVRARWNRDR